MGDTSVAALAFRLIGSLAIVVGLLFLIARFANRRMKAPAGAAVQVVAKQALSRSSGVAVLTVGPRVLVVGTTEQQVTLLAELDPDELLEATTEDLTDGDQPDAPDHMPADPADDADADRPVDVLALLTKKRTPAPSSSPIAGSLLSPTTWKQTFAALTGNGHSSGRKAS